MAVEHDHDHDDKMSPETSPNTLGGVRRVNNLPLYLIGGGVLAFLLVMMMVAADRASKQNQQTEEAQTDKNIDANQFANRIAGNATGLVPPAEKPVIPEPAPITIARVDNPNKPPMPPAPAVNQPRTPADEEAARIRQMKLQLMQEAIKAKTTVKITAPRSPGSSPVNNEDGRSSGSITDPTEAYIAKRNRLQQQAGMDGTAGSDYDGYGNESSALMKTGASGVYSNSNNIDQFDKKGHKDRWQLESEVDAPKSPYELRAGNVLPGTLISGINSELPGQIMAQISQNVYDTATGRYLLIPQGTRLVGAYSNQVAYGQRRVLIAWQRIVFPDGKAMDIGSMPGADEAGYGGLNDLVDNHYLRIFGSALIMSVVSAGIQYSQQGNQPIQSNGFYQPTATNTLSQALGQQLGHATAQMIQKNMNIAPTLEIRPGFRFNVIVVKDLVFSKPYQSFDY